MQRLKNVHRMSRWATTPRPCHNSRQQEPIGNPPASCRQVPKSGLLRVERNRGFGRKQGRHGSSGTRLPSSRVLRRRRNRQKPRIRSRNTGAMERNRGFGRKTSPRIFAEGHLPSSRFLPDMRKSQKARFRSTRAAEVERNRGFGRFRGCACRQSLAMHSIQTIITGCRPRIQGEFQVAAPLQPLAPAHAREPKRGCSFC